MDSKASLGLVLAGGKSSRMGTDKALLKFNGETLLARAQRILMHSKVTNVAVSRALECKHQVKDIIPNKGPLSGIHAAMHEFTDLNIVVLPVDQILLLPTTINTMIDLAQAKQINYCAQTATRHTLLDGSAAHKFSFPLYIHNTRQARDYLDSVLSAHETKRSLSVIGFLKQFPLAYLPVDDASELSNINTPEQFEFMAKNKR